MSALKPGGMGPKGASAKPADFAGSMADAMETALNTMLANDGINKFEVNTNSQEARDRRRMFVAIAQGIVRHLKDNADALWIENTLNVKLPDHIDIQTDGTLL
jgi:hypothetical protein